MAKTMINSKFLTFLNGMKGIVMLLFFSCLMVFTGMQSLAQRKEVLLSEKDEIEYLHRFIEGNKLKVLGYGSEAIMVFNKCLEIKPKAPAVHYELAWLYLGAEQYEDALDHASRAATLEPENEDFILLYARMLYQMGYTSKSIKQYKQLIRLFPLPENKFEFAQLLDDSHKTAKKALLLYQEIENENGIQEVTSFSKQRIYEKLGRQDDNLLELKKLADAFPYDTKYRVLYAEKLANAKRLPEAEIEYDRAFKSDPHNSLTSLSFAEFLLFSGQPQKSFPYIRIALDDPDFDQATKFKTLYKIYQYYAKDIPTDSLITWSKLAIVPDKPEMQLFLAGMYLKNNQIPEARNVYREILIRTKDNTDIWNLALDLSLQMKDWQAVFDDSKEALSLFPAIPSYFLMHAQSAYNLKKYESGYDALKTGLLSIIDNKPLEYSFYVYLGETTFRLDKFDESFNYFEKAVRIDSSDASLLNNYSYYLALKNKNLNRALELTNRSNQLSPQQSNYLDTKAWVLFRLQKYQDALDIINTAISLSENPGFTLYEHKGDILFWLNNLEEAQIFWNKSVENGNNSDIIKEKINSSKWSE